MRDEDSTRLRDLAARVAEGEPIDWAAEEGRAESDKERKAILGLRVLEEFARAREGPSGTGTTRMEPGASRASEMIGPYRLLQKLGEGGMGEVWEAEQTEPVRRKVALKLIKRGMDTDHVVARFEAERQALALMDHPSIARVLDAGATGDGRPYFVMELVRGMPVTEHCDQRRLGTAERLALFQQVCEAVQHAHQKAIIHRDIKPSNVLVTLQDGRALPKVIDFGVAKAVGQRLVERTLFTEVGQLVGTPAYMSPEQARMTGQDVDTRTDVYSLGVLLYEILVGAPPFDPKELRRAAFDEICRRIREEEPPKPSTRVSGLGDASTTSARNRRLDPRTLTRQLRGDLDWITMRALEKDRARRYGSPAELAADIGRYLTDEPVVAGPPSVAYRVRKFTRRHRLGVGIAAAGLLVLVAFAGTMTVQSVRIARERDRANREAVVAGRVTDFMGEVFDLSDPSRTRGETVTAGELLERAVERVEEELAGEPEIGSRLMYTMGLAYRGLGLFDRAEEVLRKSSELRRETLGAEHPDTLKTDRLLGIALWRLDRLDEARELLGTTYGKQREVLGEDHADTLRTLSNLGSVSWRRGELVEAARVFEEVLARSRLALGVDHRVTLSAMTNLAHMHYNLDRLDEAEHLQREALETQRRVLGEGHELTVESMHVLGVILRKQGRHQESEAILRETLDRFERVLGEAHLRTIATAGDLATTLHVQGRHDEAEALFRQTVEGYRSIFGDEHARTLFARHRVGRSLYAQGRFEEAKAWELEVLEPHSRVAGHDHPRTLLIVQTLAETCVALGQVDEARPFVKRLLDSRRRRAEAPGAAAGSKNAYSRYALTCEPADLRDPEQAFHLALEAVEMTDRGNADFLDTLALAYRLTGRTGKAVETQRKALAVLSEDRTDVREHFETRLAAYEKALAEENSGGS